MATLYNWSRYNNNHVQHTGYNTVTTYAQSGWVIQSSNNTQTGTVYGGTSYSFNSTNGTYSVTGSQISIPVGGSGVIYNGGGSSIGRTGVGSGKYDYATNGVTTSSTQQPYTYYTDEKGSLVNTSYEAYDAHTDGTLNTDGYWYVRGSVYNYDPTILLKDNSGTSITSNQQIPHNDKSDFKFNIIGNDSDTNDTIQYKVQLNGADHSSYINTLKGITKSYTIPFSDLTLGNNTVTVYMKDSKGYSVTQSFILRNKVPQHFSLHSVLDSETALGYGNTSFTDLQDIMPSGYSGTLSMADFIDYLS